MRMITGLCLGLTLVLGACNDPDDGGATDDGGSAGVGTQTTDGSGGLANGVYECSYNSGGMLYGLGAITIDGNRYGGFSGGMRGTYSMNADGGIAFSDGFAGTPDGFRVEGTVWRESPGGNSYIELGVVSPSGNVMTATCEE